MGEQVHRQRPSIGDRHMMPKESMKKAAEILGMTEQKTTTELIEECERLDAAATPGEWHLSADKDLITQTVHITRDVWTIPHGTEDMELIASYRTLAPLLAARCKELMELVRLAVPLVDYNEPEESPRIMSCNEVDQWLSTAEKLLGES